MADKSKKEKAANKSTSPKTQFDFSAVQLFDVGGNMIPNSKVYKTVGNAIYNGSRDLGLLPIAQEIYTGRVVELDVKQIKVIRQLIDEPRSGILAFAREALHEYIDSVEEKEEEIRNS